jgi:YfiH family protein
MITLGILENVTGIRHGFFTREGGVSEGLYASLNVGFGSGDEPSRVARNRALAMGRLGLPPEALVTAYQVHGRDVAVVEEPWKREDQPRVDALVTARPGLALGILTADCAPVLLADSKARIVAAVHAGWRGARDGVIPAAVERMCALGADRSAIVAGIGPSIAKRSYEVGPEFPELILGRRLEPGRSAADGTGDDDLFAPAPRPGHHLFDLAGYVARRLAEAGIARVARVSGDTFSEERRFFSYRRARLRGEGDYGRCLSAIALVP